MPIGSLKLNVMDLFGQPVAGRIHIDFEPARNSTGGAAMEVDFTNQAATQFTIEEIQCSGGPGTLYTIRINNRNFHTYGFFQLILEQKVNTASDNTIRLLVNPKRVQDIDAPAFASLPAPERRFLTAAEMAAPEAGDRDLVGLAGPPLYEELGPLRKACLLNIFKKAKHPSAGGCFRFLQAPMVLRQDRCFCMVDPALPEVLRKSERFKSAPNSLHKPIKGFALEDSFKSMDAVANLQLTFMRHTSSGALAADVDIDEANGIEHGFEVIRNTVTKGRTNPYLVRELMLLFDPVEKVLDPGYGFVFS